jgi:nucleoside-diphosphate-sugar epimerase
LLKLSLKMNILITGANGFLGKALTKKFFETTNKLFLVSREKDFEVKGAKVYIGDISNESFCKEIVSDIDTVYYLAGYKKNIAFHTKIPSEFIFGNVEPLISFLKALKNSQVKTLVYMSSTNVALYKEGDNDGYIIGKYINELILKSFAKESGIDIKTVRAPGIYGPGDNFNPETANFIPSMINKVFQSSSEIVVWGAGKREIQFIFVDDLVNNLIKISKTEGNLFTVGNSEVLTINQIAEKIIGLSGKKVIIKNDPSKPDKESFLFDFKNVIQEETSFEDGLTMTINYYKKLHA